MPTVAPLHSAQSPVTRFRWFICALLFFATTINYIDRQILALLKPALDGELGWTNEQYGAVNSAFQAAYALSYVAFGWFIDRVGIRLGYAISIVAWSIATIGHGLVGSIRGFVFARVATVLSLGGGWLSGHFIKRGWTVTRARKTAMFVFALCVVPVVFAPQLDEWLAVCLIGLACAVHQAWSATIYATTSDMFPKRTIAAISGIAGMAGAVGGILFPPFAGKLLDYYKLTAGGESAGYAILFTMCGSAYAAAWLLNHVFAPRFDAIRLPSDTSVIS